MLRVYYSFLPLHYDRPGGVWWYRDLPEAEAREYIAAILPCAHSVRTLARFPHHASDQIEPPPDATSIFERATSPDRA